MMWENEGKNNFVALVFWGVIIYFWVSGDGLGVTKVHAKGDRTQLRESYYLKPLRL